MRVAVRKGAQPDLGEKALRALQRLAARHAVDLQRNRDIVDRGLPGNQRIGREEITGLPVEA